MSQSCRGPESIAASAEAVALAMREEKKSWRTSSKWPRGKGSQGGPWVWRFPRGTHTAGGGDTEMTYHRERIWSKSSKGKGAWGKVWEESRGKLPSPRELAQDVLNSPNIRLWPHVCHVIYQGSSLETQCQGLSLRGEHTGTFCLACIITVLPFQKESMCSA